MDDRKLLELSAKAAGYDGVGSWDEKLKLLNDHEGWWFDPLHNSADALDLAVKLRLVCGFVEPNCWAELPGQHPCYEPCKPDPYAATRRAIVRAAAAIGEQMP
jgi:hypothetical protein